MKEYGSWDTRIYVSQNSGPVSDTGRRLRRSHMSESGTTRILACTHSYSERNAEVDEKGDFEYQNSLKHLQGRNAPCRRTDISLWDGNVGSAHEDLNDYVASNHQFKVDDNRHTPPIERKERIQSTRAVDVDLSDFGHLEPLTRYVAHLPNRSTGSTTSSSSKHKNPSDDVDDIVSLSRTPKPINGSYTSISEISTMHKGPRLLHRNTTENASPQQRYEHAHFDKMYDETRTTGNHVGGDLASKYTRETIPLRQIETGREKKHSPVLGRSHAMVSRPGYQYCDFAYLWEINIKNHLFILLRRTSIVILPVFISFLHVNINPYNKFKIRKVL